MTEAETSTHAALEDLVRLRCPISEGVAAVASLGPSPESITVTGNDLTTACDRYVVGMLPAADLVAWAATLSDRADVVPDPPQAHIIVPALRAIGGATAQDLPDVVREWMVALHPPRCGGV